MVRRVWEDIPDFYTGVGIDEAVVMPDHFHGIVRLLPQGGQPQGVVDGGQPQGVVDGGQPQGVAPTGGAAPCGSPLSLPDVVRNFKSLTTTRYIHGVHEKNWPAFNGRLWHRNYWDVIVRKKEALENIRNYIRFNPQNYAAVMQCGEPRFLGNKALLALPKAGFLASRGAPSLQGSLPLRKGEVVISGFLSPMERKVFRAGLEHRKPLIWVKPWSLEEGLDVPSIQTALAEGRLLILSPFEDKTAPSVRRAAWCNEYVLAHGDRMIIGHLNPDGMLACILSEARADLEILRLAD